MTKYSIGGIMKKRIGLLILTLTLLVSGITVEAREIKDDLTVDKYINFFLDEVMGTKNGEAISALRDTLEEMVENVSLEDVRKILDFISENVSEEKLKSLEGIKEIIAEYEKEFDVTLTKEQINKILSLVKKIEKSGISVEYLLKQAEEIYEKYGDELTEDMENGTDKVMKEAQSKIKEEVKKEVSKSVSNYFSDMVNNVKSFFKGIFKK